MTNWRRITTNVGIKRSWKISSPAIINKSELPRPSRRRAGSVSASPWCIGSTSGCSIAYSTDRRKPMAAKKRKNARMPRDWAPPPKILRMHIENVASMALVYHITPERYAAALSVKCTTLKLFALPGIRVPVASSRCHRSRISGCARDPIETRCSADSVRSSM